MINQTLCPLCNQPNMCHIAAVKNANDCWCMQAKIAPAALAQLAPVDINQSCICSKCAKSSHTPKTNTE